MIFSISFPLSKLCEKTSTNNKACSLYSLLLCCTVVQELSEEIMNSAYWLSCQELDEQIAICLFNMKLEPEA